MFKPIFHLPVQAVRAGLCALPAGPDRVAPRLRTRQCGTCGARSIGRVPSAGRQRTPGRQLVGRLRGRDQADQVDR
jgi:hypothetical protein